MAYAATEGMTGPGCGGASGRVSGPCMRWGFMRAPEKDRERERQESQRTVEPHRLTQTIDPRTVRHRPDRARRKRAKEGDAPALVLALVEPLGPGHDHARHADDEVEEHVRGREARVLVETVVLRSAGRRGSVRESRRGCGEGERTVDPATEAAMSPEMPT